MSDFSALAGKCCPSSADWSVRFLIGRRSEDGTTQYAKELVPADEKVFNYLKLVGDDTDYRFGGVCMQGKCVHWSDGCGLGVAVTAVANEDEMEPRSPCAFKDYCRWYAENGSDACSGCTYVSRGTSGIVDLREIG